MVHSRTLSWTFLFCFEFGMCATRPLRFWTHVRCDLEAILYWGGRLRGNRETVMTLLCGPKSQGSEVKQRRPKVSRQQEVLDSSCVTERCFSLCRLCGRGTPGKRPYPTTPSCQRWTRAVSRISSSTSFATSFDDVSNLATRSSTSVGAWNCTQGGGGSVLVVCN